MASPRRPTGPAIRREPRPRGLASAFVGPDTDPIDPPVPVPDVPGADVPPGADRLPPLSALSPHERRVVAASAAGDIALRTWVSSLLAATAAPVVVATALRHTESGSARDNLKFYAELGAEHDPVKSFPAPTELPRVSSRPAGRIARWIARGTVENISFPSSFSAINPAMRDRWNGWRSNNIARAQHCSRPAGRRRPAPRRAGCCSGRTARSRPAPLPPSG